MKSAIELAMEKAESLEGGKVSHLTGEQKKKIGEIRNIAESKIAQAEIMLDTEIAKFGGDITAIENAKANFRREKGKIERDAQANVEKVKAG